MNIDRKSDFGKLEPLMRSIHKHIKTDADPDTNGSRYNIIWNAFYKYLKSIEQPDQSKEIQKWKERTFKHKGNVEELMGLLSEINDIHNETDDPECNCIYHRIHRKIRGEWI